MDTKICKCGRDLFLYKKIQTKNKNLIYKFKDVMGLHIHNKNDHHHIYKCILNHEYIVYYPYQCLCGWFSI